MVKSLPDSQRVVITGLGAVTAFGLGVDSLWEGLISKKSCLSRIEKFDASTYTCQIAGEIKHFDASQFMDAKDARRNDPYACYAVAGAKLAVEDANLPVADLNKKRFGVMIGSGIGGMKSLLEQTKIYLEKGNRYVSPFTITSVITNIASGLVAIAVGARGPNFAPVSACASGSHAIGEAYEMIKYGRADVMLAGGTEAAVNPISMAGFCSMKAMATSFNDMPETASRPFDATRDGFVMSEGSGVVVLESLEHAKQRGAHIYCEIIGYALSCDAYHITSPDPESNGLISCFEDLLAYTGLSPKDIDYINAHGTSTFYNDRGETKAVKAVFGDYAKDVIMTSTKSQTGHLLGAAGGIEAIICAKTIKHGKIIGTMNYSTPDPECDLNYLPNQVIDKRVDLAISDNLGFGGQNVALMFASYKE